MVSFGACDYGSKKKEEPILYKKNGLSFNLPKYWEVKKDRPIEGVEGARLISISNEEPFSKDSYLVITVINKEDNLENAIERIIRTLGASHNKRKIEFGILDKVAKIKIGNIDALRVGFETRIIANRNKGNITVFNLKGKNYSFVFSADVKEAKEDVEIVEQIIKSLKSE